MEKALIEISAFLNKNIVLQKKYFTFILLFLCFIIE